MPSEQQLKEKARAMVLAMQERARWIYALPAGSFAAAVAILEAAGVPRVDAAEAGTVVKHQSDDGKARYVVFDHAELGAVLLEGEGGDAVPLLAKVLEATGFLPQSRLWAEALAVGEPQAGRALRLLAHMAVGWDGDWSDLFLLHLASPDPIARHGAALGLVTAAMVSGTVGPALELLAEARRRETFPKLAQTLEEAATALQGFAGQPVDAGALEPPES
jgi:hypothetical protein